MLVRARAGPDAIMVILMGPLITSHDRYNAGLPAKLQSLSVQPLGRISHTNERFFMTSPQFRAASTGRVIRAVLFDTFGTVVDWREGIATAVAGFADRHSLALDAHAFADAWRNRYQPSMEPIRSGERDYASLDILHLENLEYTLARADVDRDLIKEHEIEELSRAWHRLDPWADSVPGLTRIKKNYIIGPLSNGNTSLLLNMAKDAGIPWDVIIGSDITRIYKPHPDSYRKTAATLGLHPGEVLFVAAHNADLDSARAAGLATAFITRPTEHGATQTTDLEPTDDWDFSALDITDLAAQLEDATGVGKRG